MLGERQLPCYQVAESVNTCLVTKLLKARKRIRSGERELARFAPISGLYGEHSLSSLGLASGCNQGYPAVGACDALLFERHNRHMCHSLSKV
jgi:hypothetical protein